LSCAIGFCGSGIKILSYGEGQAYSHLDSNFSVEELSAHPVDPEIAQLKGLLFLPREFVNGKNLKFEIYFVVF
jgi:hypothetical protein